MDNLRRVIVDVDGVLARTIPFLSQLVWETWGCHVDPANWKRFLLHNFDTRFTEGDTKILMQQFHVRLHELEPVEDSVWGLKRLNAKYRTVIVTNRPEWTLKDTIAWLDKWDYPHDVVVAGMDRVNLINKDTPALIDDSASTMEMALEKKRELKSEIKLILMDMPHNKRLVSRDVLRVRTWNEIVAAVYRSELIS